MPYDPKASLLAKVNAMEALAKSGAPVNPVDPAYNQWRPDFKATPVQSVQAPVQPMAQSQSSSQAPASDDPNARLQAYLAQSGGQQVQPATQAPKKNFLQNIVGGFTDTAATGIRAVQGVGRGVQAIGQTIIGDKEGALETMKKADEDIYKPVNIPLLGQGNVRRLGDVNEKGIIVPSKETLKTVGTAADVASFFMNPASGAKNVVPSIAKQRFVQGSLQAGGTKLAETGDVGKATGAAFLGGGLNVGFGKVTDKIASKISAKLAQKSSGVASKSLMSKGAVPAVETAEKIAKRVSPNGVMGKGAIPAVETAEKIAQRRGVSDKATRLIAEAADSPSELRLMARMQDIAETASKTETPAQRPELVVGEAINSKVGKLIAARSKAGKALASAFDDIPKRPVDLSKQAQELTSAFQDLGIKISPSGKLDFRSSSFSGSGGGSARTLFEEAYNAIKPNAKGQSVRMPSFIRATRQKLFRVLDLDKAGELFTGQDKAIIGRFRDSLDEPLRAMSPKYAQEAQKYARLTSATSDFYKLMGKKFVDADDKILDIRAGEIANRLLSNSSSDVERVLSTLDELLPNKSRLAQPDLKRLVAFNQMLQDLYGITPLTSSQGRMERGAENVVQGIDVAGKLLRKDVTGLVETGAKKLLGITPEKQQSAIRTLIASHGMTEQAANEVVSNIGALKIPATAKIKLLDKLPDLTTVLMNAFNKTAINPPASTPVSPQMPQSNVQSQDPNELLMKEIERLKAAQ